MSNGNAFWGLSLLGGGFLLLMKALGKPSGMGASIKLDILDAVTREPVPRNSPATVMEGTAYVAAFTVTNQYTRLGSPVGADLRVAMDGQAGALTITLPASWVTSHAAGEAVAWDIPFYVPDGTGPGSGLIQVRVLTPDGNTLLAEAQEPLTIQSAVVVPGASITPIGVS